MSKWNHVTMEKVSVTGNRKETKKNVKEDIEAINKII